MTIQMDNYVNKFAAEAQSVTTDSSPSFHMYWCLSGVNDNRTGVELFHVL
jgi:hypothetical protein